MTKATHSNYLNGIDVTKLSSLAAGLKENAQAGRVTFTTHSLWQDGARVLTRVAGFTVDDQAAHTDTRRFVLLGDEPTELAGTDAAPGPAEQLMHATASCIAATVNANAALMGITLERLEIDIEGDIDLHGILALDAAVRPGFGELRVKISLAGDADNATLEEIAERGVAFSPIRDSVERGVRLTPAISVLN